MLLVVSHNRWFCNQVMLPRPTDGEESGDILPSVLTVGPRCMLAGYRCMHLSGNVVGFLGLRPEIGAEVRDSVVGGEGFGNETVAGIFSAVHNLIARCVDVVII